MTHTSRSAEQTVELGSQLGRELHRGRVVALHGPLGAGKTTLVKGIARSLEIEEPVTSPSFTLIAEYAGRRDGESLVLYHVDLYRIGHPQEIEDLGMEEIMESGGICVIEWAEKAGAFLPQSAVHVDLTLLPGGDRRVEVQGLEHR